MIVVTGGSGQVATALARAGAGRVRVVGRPGFDFDRPETIGSVLEGGASLVVNTAAWTAVDAAEADPDGARRANADGPAELARLCAASGVPLIHIGTDYVFDGDKGAPYTEDDAPRPTGVYGATKLAGEQAVLGSGGTVVVLRTSWVYSATGKNFVKTMLNAALKTDTLRVVGDQRGCPTAADDIADAVLAIAAQLRADHTGTYHMAGTGDTTWHGLAVAVFEQAARYDRAMPTVHAIATADWPTPARRPADSRLDCTRLQRTFGVRLPPWRDSLARTVDAYLAA